MEEKIFLVSPNCEGCRELEEQLTANGTIEKYKIIDISTDYGRMLVEKLGLEVVPSCVVVRQTSEGHEARVCEPKEFLAVLKEKII